MATLPVTNLDTPLVQDTVELGEDSANSTLEAGPQPASSELQSPRSEAPLSASGDEASSLVFTDRKQEPATVPDEVPGVAVTATAMGLNEDTTVDAKRTEERAERTEERTEDYALLDDYARYDAWSNAGSAMIQRAEDNLNIINSAYATGPTTEDEDTSSNVMPRNIYNDPAEKKPDIWDTLVGWKGDFVEKKRELGDYIQSTGVGKALNDFWEKTVPRTTDLTNTEPTDENLRTAYAFMSRLNSSIEGLHLFGGRDPETIERDRQDYLWAQEVIQRGDNERGWSHGQPSLSFLEIMKDTPQALAYWGSVVVGSVAGHYHSPINMFLSTLPIVPFLRLGTQWQMAAARTAYHMGARSTFPIVAAAIGGRVLGGAVAGFVHQASLDLLLYHPQYSETLEQMGFEVPGALDSMLYSGIAGATMAGGLHLLTAPWRRLSAAARAGLEHPYPIKDVTPESPAFTSFKEDVGQAADNYIVDIYNRAGGPLEDSNYAYGSLRLGGPVRPAIEVSTALPHVIKAEPATPGAEVEQAPALPNVIEVEPTPPGAEVEQAVALPTVIEVPPSTVPEALQSFVPDYSILSGRDISTGPTAESGATTTTESGAATTAESEASDTSGLDGIRMYTSPTNTVKTDEPLATESFNRADTDIAESTEVIKVIEAAQNAQTAPGTAPDKPQVLTGSMAQNAQDLKERAQKMRELAEVRKQITPIVQKAEVAFNMALQKIKEVSEGKLRFSPEVEALIKSLAEGASVTDQATLDKMIAEIKTKEQAVQRALGNAAKVLDDALEILNLAKPFVQGTVEVASDLNKLITQVRNIRDGVAQRMRLLNLLTGVMEGYKNRLNSPLAPARAVEEFVQTINNIFEALSPGQPDLGKPLGPKALAGVLDTIKKVLQNNTAETSTYVGVNEQYKAHIKDGEQYGIKPSPKAAQLLEELQANIEAAEKIIQEITRLSEEVAQLNSQVQPAGGTTPDQVIVRALQLKDLQEKINNLALKVLRHAQINAVINKLLQRAAKVIQPTPPGLVSTQPADVLDAVFAQVPNVPQLLQNQAFNKRGITLLLNALRAQGLSNVEALKAALGVATIAEFVEKVSTESGNQDIVAKLKAYENSLKEKKAQSEGDLEPLAYPFAEMKKADIVLRRAIKVIGKIHQYIIKKGGVGAFLNNKNISIATIDRILKDIYDVLQILKNMDRLDLSANKLSDSTVQYIKQLESLHQYMTDVKHYRMSLDTVAAPLIDKKAHVIGILSERFKGNHLLEFSDFFGLYQINPPNKLNPRWHFSHSNTQIPIGSLEDLGDIFNAVFMHWLEKAPLNTPKGFAADFTRNFINSLLGRGTSESLTRAGVIRGMLLDLYHKENAALNEINGDLWLGITDKEGRAIRANTFTPEANHYFYEKYTTGQSKIDIKNPHLKSGLDKIIENARAVDKNLRDTWRRLGLPVQEINNYLPQNHDRLKIGMVTKDQFVKSVLPLLDVDKMKIPTATPEGRPLTPQELDTAQKAWLGAVYDHLTAHPDSGLNYEGGSMGSLFLERELHFKDAASFLQYQAAFGSSHFVIQSLTDHFFKTGRQQALARTFGPASGRLIMDMHKFFTAQLEQVKGTGTSLYGSEREIASLINGLYEMINPVEGVVYPNMTVKALKTAEGLTVAALLKNVSHFSMFTELYQIQRIKQELGLAPPTSPFISALQALGMAAPEVAAWLLRPVTAFYRSLAGLTGAEAKIYADLAFAGLLFHNDTQLVSRTNRTPSTMRYPWAQELENKIDKVVGTSHQTMRNRIKAGVFFQKEMHDLLSKSWSELPEPFVRYLQRTGLREEDWGKLAAAKKGGYMPAYVAPDELGGRVSVNQFSPALFMRAHGTPGTLGYNPKLAEIGKKLMIVQSLFVGEGVLQTNPYVKGWVLKRGTGKITQTRQDLPALMVDMSVSSLTLFTGWGQTFLQTFRRYGGQGGISAFMVGGLIVGMSMLTLRATARGQTFDWTAPASIVRGFLAVGGGNYLDVLVNDGMHILKDPDAISSNVRALAQKGFHPALDTIVRLGEAGWDASTWDKKTPAEKTRAMKGVRKLHDLIMPDPYQAISNRFLLDNLFRLMDPKAADKLFRNEIKNKSIYSDSEYIRGLKPGDWTTKALPESLRNKKQYQEAEAKKKERAAKKKPDYKSKHKPKFSKE